MSFCEVACFCDTIATLVHTTLIIRLMKKAQPVGISYRADPAVLPIDTITILTWKSKMKMACWLWQYNENKTDEIISWRRGTLAATCM